MDGWLEEREYEADDVLVVSDPTQLRALGDDVRSRIIAHLGRRAASVSELAVALDMPKGTVGHHVKVLEQAGLARVVHTRRVRALTEKFYGRAARLFLFESGDESHASLVYAAGATALRTAAAELPASPAVLGHGLVRARLTPEDARRLQARLKKLLEDFRAADSRDGVWFRLALALYEQDDPDA